MQESKYAEDIIGAIKRDLAARGFLNEHDRLGHFESVVPLDTLFAIARPQNRVKIFALQFKAPQLNRRRLRWRLTHPEAQFHKLVDGWHRLIWYCFPHYLTPLESAEPLSHSLFATSKDMAAHARFVGRGVEPLPRRWLNRLYTFLLFYDHPDCERIMDSLASKSWSDLGPSMLRVTEAIVHCGQYEHVVALKGPDWDARTALVSGLWELSRKFECSLPFLANSISDPEAKSAPSTDGPFQYLVKNSKLRAALKNLASELEHRYNKTLGDLYGDNRPHCPLGSQIITTVEYQSLCEEVLASGDQRTNLTQELHNLTRLGFDAEYLNHYRSSLCELPSRYKFPRQNFRTRLVEFEGRILPAETIPALAATNVKLATSLHVSVTSELPVNQLACESHLKMRNIEYWPIRDIEELPLNPTILKYKELWPSLAWCEYFNAVESCQIGLPLNDQVRDDLQSSFADLFEGNQDGLLVWCDFTEKLCYTIEVRRVSAGTERSAGGLLSIAQDPLTAGVRPEIRQWVFEESRRRGVRMTDVVEEALERMRTALDTDRERET